MTDWAMNTTGMTRDQIDKAWKVLEASETCPWCGTEVSEGQHGMIETTVDGAASVKCYVKMLVHMPRKLGVISGTT